MPREVGSCKCRRPRFIWKLINPFWKKRWLWLAPLCIRELCHLVNWQHRWIIPSPDRPNSSCSSAELSAVIVACNCQTHPPLPYETSRQFIGSFTAVFIGVAPSGENPPVELSHWRSASAGLRRGRERRGVDIGLGRLYAKPYDGLIFQGSSRVPAQAAPRDWTIACEMGIRLAITLKFGSTCHHGGCLWTIRLREISPMHATSFAC